MDSAIAYRIGYVFVFSSALLLVMFSIGTVSGLTWHNETVDAAGNVGFHTSLALDNNGNPRISYTIKGIDAWDGGLKYAWHDGSGWHTETVDTMSYGGYTSLKLDRDGNPRISYEGDFNLKYAWRNATGWHIEIVDSVGSAGGYTSLVLDENGHPRISYVVGNPIHALKYALYNSTGWHTEFLDSENGNAWFGTSLGLDVFGNPRICSSVSPSSYPELNYLIFAWNDGSSWQFELVNGRPVAGLTSMQLDEEGNPRVAYQMDEYSKYMCYGRRGPTGWQDEVVDESGNVGYSKSLALDGTGNPQISYLGYFDWASDPLNHDLKHAWRDATGWHYETVDSAGYTGEYASLALDSDGNPRISYYDETNGDLKYAWADISAPAVLALPGVASIPTDSNGDGKFEDVNGNGVPDFADLVLYFQQIEWIAANEPPSAFDYNGNGGIDFADVIWLFNHL